MSLTIGSVAPFGRPCGGTVNFGLPDKPAHLLYLHGLPARIRGVVGGVAVVDSGRAQMLHETALLPRWYFPREEVRTELLEPSQTTSHCPFKGDARYWHLRAGDRVIEDAFWEYPEPLPGAPSLVGLLSPYTEKFDQWFEEDEEVLGHPRDPFHRVDARRSTRNVEVRLENSSTVLVRSSKPVAVNETGIQTRWYLPREAVLEDVLQRSEKRTVCPYKGVATYWNVIADGRTLPDAAWSYEDPLLEALPAKGHLCFDAEDIAIEVS